MTLIKTIGLYLLFFSFPFIAILKGKGIVLSLVLSFFLFNGPSAIKTSFKAWGNKKSRMLELWIVGIVVFFLESFHAAQSFTHLLRLIVLFFLAFFTIKGCTTLAHEDQKKAIHLFFLGYLVYVLFFLFELYGGSWASKLYAGSRGYDLTLFIRGIVILTFLFLPFSWYLTKLYTPSKNRIYLGASLLVLMIILIKAQPSAARLAVTLGAFFFIIGYFYKRSGFILVGIVGAYMIAAPFLFFHSINRQTLFNVMHHLPLSYQHRIEIWHETAKHVMHHPFIGHGLNHASKLEKSTSRCAHHGTKDFPSISLNDVISKEAYPWGGVVCYKDSVLTTHPHNGALQIWLEFGLVGIGIFCFLLYRFALCCSSCEPLYRGYLYSLFGFCLVYWNVSFGLWQNWMIALVSLTFMLFQLIKGLPSKKTGNNRCMS